MLSKKKIEKLRKISKQIKIDIVTMAYNAKSAHAGGALSCVEILTALYFHSMHINPKKPKDENRDRLIFSKGHDSKALYATLARKGFFSQELLKTHEQDNGKLPGHPIRGLVPGIEVSTGSLGHGLSIAAGMSYFAKLEKKKHRIYAIISDGECDEGSTWEAILFAGHHKLHNLIVIVDYNKILSFGYTKEVLDLDPLSEKFKSFNWTVSEVNGHDIKEIISAIDIKSDKKPHAIIAHTIKGFEGPQQHIGKNSSHYKPPTLEELKEVTERLSKS